MTRSLLWKAYRLLINWQAEGFDICAECVNAAEALALLQDTKPDLIVTDIRMPGIDGLEMMVQARARGFGGEFVVVSGYGDFEYAQKALRIGVAGYLLKPVEPEEAGLVLENVRQRLVRREAAGSERFSQYQSGITALLADQGVPLGTYSGQ